MQCRTDRRAQVCREAEQWSRHCLRGTVSGEKIRLVHPALRHHRALQQRQHHVSAAEHQRPRAIKRAEDLHRLGTARPDYWCMFPGGAYVAAAPPSAPDNITPATTPALLLAACGSPPPAGHRCHSAAIARPDRADRNRQHRTVRREPSKRTRLPTASGAVRSQRPAHGNNRLRHHGHGHQLQPMHHAQPHPPVSRRCPKANSSNSTAEGHGETQPRRRPAPSSRRAATPAQSPPGCSPARAGPAPRYDLGIALLVAPAPALHELRRGSTPGAPPARQS